MSDILEIWRHEENDKVIAVFVKKGVVRAVRIGKVLPELYGKNLPTDDELLKDSLVYREF